MVPPSSNDPRQNKQTAESSAKLTARILVCDDDSDTRSIVNHTLSVLGHEVVEAESGEVAISLCEESLPDLIVMDIMMPGVTGLDFVKWLRLEVQDRFVPVLFLTALSEVESKVEGLEIGGNDYLTKPFNYKELQARVDSLLRIRDLTEQLRKANFELTKAQAQLIEKERELVVLQLGGAAAHNLGQPLTSILLNCTVLEKKFDKMEQGNSSENDAKQMAVAVKAIKSECECISGVLEKLKSANPKQTSSYVGGIEILDLHSQPDKKK
jgi:DNA-binding response OmpR family regulator